MVTSGKGGVLAGVAAALFGLAAGDLAAALINPDASPIVVVGAEVIDLTPTVVKEWAVAHLGTADKPILVVSVGIVVLAVAALAGWAAVRRRHAGAVVFAALGAVAAGIALTRGNALDAVPAAVTAAAAMATLRVLLRPAGGSRLAEAGGRRLFVRALILVVAAAATEPIARQTARRRTVPQDVRLPRPRRPLRALPQGLDLPDITPFRTSRRDFYRVDTRLTLPRVDVDTWRLRVDGRVRRPLALTFEQLAAMEVIERDITLTCVSNDVGGRYVGGARWLGVRLTDVLQIAGVEAGADQILSTDVDGMTISTPLDIATDGRDAMIAIGMNGRPLPPQHGFPARLVVPGLYGFVGATKWIARMTLTTYAEQDAYWTKRGWATDAPIKPSSRIDTPRPFQSLRAGDTVTIGGIAWAQGNGGIAGVEVSIDDRPWQPATLGPSGGADYWRQWYLTWPATAGSHTIAARAIPVAGHRQSARRAAPFPNGSSGIQRLTITVDQSDRSSAPNES
ncbi:MAG: molybdopterin-dependent oxidoreductase [Aeromicrobium sp.]